MSRYTPTAIALILLAAACGSDNRPSDGAGADVPADTAADSEADAGPDPDAGSDSLPTDTDAGADSGGADSRDVADTHADPEPTDTEPTDQGVPDTNDGSGDTGDPDVGADTGDDTSDDSGPDAACDYLDLDIVIVRCGGELRYVRTFRDLADTPGCPPYVRVQGSDVEYPDTDAAFSREDCDPSCVWRAGTSVSWLRCGRRSGYIVYRADGCDDLYEMPEGLFQSLQEHDAAHPCPVESRPAGQCVTSADCPGISTCSSAAPGGICTGCGSIADCPEAADECSEFGACAISCTTDAQCPRGQSCAGTGMCRIAACVAGACPDSAFGCSERDLCERVACPGGDECPTGTTCTAGRCVEIR